MAPLFGGKRDRMIEQSLYQMLAAAIEDLGWHNPGRHLPVTVTDETVDIHSEIVPNVVALSSENTPQVAAQLGSTATVNSHDFYTDVYAEDDSFGKHLVGDIMALYLGQLPTIGATRPSLPVYDMDQATPTVEFYCDIDNVQRHRAHDFPHPWLSHWYSVSCTIVDEMDDTSS